jgi:hypothetical protein
MPVVRPEAYSVSTAWMATYRPGTCRALLSLGDSSQPVPRRAWGSLTAWLALRCQTMQDQDCFGQECCAQAGMPMTPNMRSQQALNLNLIRGRQLAQVSISPPARHSWAPSVPGRTRT